MKVAKWKDFFFSFLGAGFAGKWRHDLISFPFRISVFFFFWEQKGWLCTFNFTRKKNIFSFQSFPEKIDYFGFSKKWLNEMCKNKESVVPDQSVIFEKFKSWRQRDEFVRENACRELSI